MYAISLGFVLLRALTILSSIVPPPESNTPDYKLLYEQSQVLYKQLQTNITNNECKITNRYVVSYYEILFINANSLKTVINVGIDKGYYDKQQKFLKNPDEETQKVLELYHIFYDQTHKVPIPLSAAKQQSNVPLRPIYTISIFEKWMWFLHTVNSTQVHNCELQYWPRVIKLFDYHYKCGIPCLAGLIAELKHEGDTFLLGGFNQEDVDIMMETRATRFSHVIKMKKMFKECVLFAYENKGHLKRTTVTSKEATSKFNTYLRWYDMTRNGTAGTSNKPVIDYLKEYYTNMYAY